MLLALVLAPAVVAPIAAFALLFAPWFDAAPTFAALFGHRPGVLLHPSAWEAFARADVLIALCALVALGCAMAVWSGRFVLWTGGVAAAAVGTAVCLYARDDPPVPGPGIFTRPEDALDPTAVPLLTTACFVVAALSLMAYVVVAQRLSRRPG